jgi:cbb3-type cytochrome oxidase maturation protein
LSVIIILILASLLVASGFLLAFIWSVRKGQFEDEVSPSVRMLFEDKTFSDTSSTRQKP